MVVAPEKKVIHVNVADAIRHFVCSELKSLGYKISSPYTICTESVIPEGAFKMNVFAHSPGEGYSKDVEAVRKAAEDKFGVNIETELSRSELISKNRTR